MSSDALPARVAEAIASRELLDPGQRVLVAVSGGPDSSALALVLHALRYEVALAYADHGWRGADGSATEREAVRKLADHLSVPVHVIPPDEGVKRTEGAARAWRYRVLSGVMNETGHLVLATGHHRADQIETLFMRLLRGSGALGLAGIPWERGLQRGRFRVVRPLLDETPEDLRAVVAAQGLTWVEDPSNVDPAFERPRAAARLARARPQTREAMAKICELVRMGLEAARAQLRTELGESMRVHRQADAVEVPRALVVDAAARMHLLVSVLGEAVHANEHGPWLTKRHVNLMSSLAQSGGDLDLPKGLHWHVRGKRAWLWRRANPTTSWALHTESHAEVSPSDATDRTDGVLLAQDPVGEPTLRPLRTDDTFMPFGRNQPNEVRVVDWLKRRGVPAPVRARQWVVESRDHIVWVVGHRIDRRVALQPGTQNGIELRVSKAPELN